MLRKLSLVFVLWAVATLVQGATLERLRAFVRDTQTARAEFTQTVTDKNGRITSAEYDGMGRLTAVWKPGRDKGVQAPNETYLYEVRNNAPTTVTTASGRRPAPATSSIRDACPSQTTGSSNGWM